MKKLPAFAMVLISFMTFSQSFNARPGGTQKPTLHGKNWMSITGKPLAATAGAITFQKGGNAVDARSEERRVGKECRL